MNFGAAIANVTLIFQFQGKIYVNIKVNIFIKKKN